MINEIVKWLLSSMDELIDCDYLAEMEDNKNDKLRGEGLASFIDDSRESGRYNQR